MSRAYGAARAPDHDFADWPRRVSYLIAPDGTVAKAYRVEDVNTHPDEVLSDLLAASGS